MEQPAASSIAIYARKSTESEDRQVLSIDSQVKELKASAVREGIRVSHVFIESKSAKAPGRPVFNEMFALIQKHKIDAIMSWKLDRIARNPVDGGAVIWAMEERQLQAVYTPQRVFVNSGNDKFMMQLEFGMAKKYVDDLSDNTKRGLRAKLELGWRPGLAPLGYLNDKEKKIIVKDPERFPLVRRMWNLMLTGNYSAKSVLNIASDQWGLRTRVLKRIGGGKVSYSGVYDLFTSPFYCGLIRYRGDLHKGAHEAMVTKAEYDRMQVLLTSRHKRRKRIHKFKYTGLIRCGECGASITAEHKTNRYGSDYLYYHCTKRRRSVECNQGVIHESNLERQISDFLKTISLPRPLAHWALGVLDKLEAEERGAVESEKSSLSKRIDGCAKELTALLDLRLRGVINDGEYSTKKQLLEEEKLSLEESASRGGQYAEDVTDACREILGFASLASKRFREGSDLDKRAILNFTGSNLTLEHGILRISPQKPLEFINNDLSDQSPEFARFEPGIRGELKPKNPREDAGFQALLRTVKTIRTFFKDHPEEVVKARAFRTLNAIRFEES